MKVTISRKNIIIALARAKNHIKEIYQEIEKEKERLIQEEINKRTWRISKEKAKSIINEKYIFNWQSPITSTYRYLSNIISVSDLNYFETDDKQIIEFIADYINNNMSKYDIELS
jgi:sugar-specific transcriptional regulator TrmB